MHVVSVLCLFAMALPVLRFLSVRQSIVRSKSPFCRFVRPSGVCAAAVLLKK